METIGECPQTAEEFFDGLRVSCMKHLHAVRRSMVFETVANTPVGTLSELALTLVENVSFNEVPNDLVDVLESLAREIEEARILHIVPVRRLVSVALLKADAMVRDAKDRHAAEVLDNE